MLFNNEKYESKEEKLNAQNIKSKKKRRGSKKRISSYGWGDACACGGMDVGVC